jgi:hypothetical protein
MGQDSRPIVPEYKGGVNHPLREMPKPDTFGTEEN